VKTVQPVWPPNNGFIGKPESTTLEVGSTFERIGKEVNGLFASPIGTPFVQKSLPPSYADLPMHVYKVIKPIDNVLVGKIAPWFGMEGGGIQYSFGNVGDIRFLKLNEYIKMIK
ncbi:MAG: TNT domain-containing protein, partial [Anaerolineaceae bacterium]